MICTETTKMGVNISNITRVIQWKMLENLTFASFMQYFVWARQNLCIAAVLLLFIKDCYLLPNNINSIMEKTIIYKNLEIVKISLF